VKGRRHQVLAVPEPVGARRHWANGSFPQACWGGSPLVGVEELLGVDPLEVERTVCGSTAATSSISAFM